MKIAILGSHPFSLVNFRGSMIRGLADMGHEVHALAPGAMSFKIRLSDLGAVAADVKMSRSGLNPMADMRTVVATYKLLKIIRPDLLFAYTIKPVVYGSMAAKLAGVRAVVSMITGLGWSFEQAGIKGMIKYLYKPALALNQAVVFQNPDDLAAFRTLGLIGKNKKTFISNGSGVDLEHFHQAPLPQGPPVFLCIARLLKAKGLAEYARACEILRAKYPKARFQLLGPHDPGPDGLDMDLVKSWNERGILEYLGQTEDVRPYLKQASVFVLPSYREGTPRTALEAMATGRPVVTTAVPGCRQTVLDGETGFLVPPRDSEALARAMENFMTTPELAAKMGGAAHELAREKFDVNKVNQTIFQAMGLK